MDQTTIILLMFLTAGACAYVWDVIYELKRELKEHREVIFKMVQLLETISRKITESKKPP